MSFFWRVVNQKLIMASRLPLQQQTKSLRSAVKRRGRPIKSVPKTERCLDIVIVGAPNAGKSMLLNSLVSEKVAAASRKKHTTRGEILGVFNHKNIQLAFHDTPGYLRTADARQKDVKALNGVVMGAVGKAHVDVCMVVVDSARRLDEASKEGFAELIRGALKRGRCELVLVLNKVDRVQTKTFLLDTAHELVSLINGVKAMHKLGLDHVPVDGQGEEMKLLQKEALSSSLDTIVFYTSALQREGLADLKNYLLSIAPRRAWRLSRYGHFNLDTDRYDNDDKEDSDDWTVPVGPIDIATADIDALLAPSIKTKSNHVTMRTSTITSQSSFQVVEQYILEAMMENLHQEIPYEAEIQCHEIDYIDNCRRIRIRVSITVSNERQARAVVGDKARTLLKIRQHACSLLDVTFEKGCILHIDVQVRGQNSRHQSNV